MENSNTPTQTQDPPVAEIVKAAGLEPTEAMVEAAARAMCAAAGEPWDELSEDAPSLHIFSRAVWRGLAGVALIAGIAAALQEGR